MTGAHEVSATDVQAEVDLGGVSGDGVVVAFYVGVEGLFGSFGIGFVFDPAGEHFFGAEI